MRAHDCSQSKRVITIAQETQDHQRSELPSASPYRMARGDPAVVRWPISELAAVLMEVRLVRHTGPDLLGLGSSILAHCGGQHRRQGSALN